MSSDFLQRNVIQHLERSGFTFLKCLGSGSYADVIAVLTPSKIEVAVKIVQKEDIWEVEDKVWPMLQHPNLLPVVNVQSIESLNVKLYFMPIMPNALDFTVHGDEFRRDPDGLNKIKKWFRQILSALDYLHSSGLCHLDVKSDNVLIDERGDAQLCDFSGLDFTWCALERICSPLIFRPPECFASDGASSVKGPSFDLWTFGVLALNVLTGHDYAIKLNRLEETSRYWMMQMWPILENTMKEANFEKLMRRALPNVCLSKSDIHQALHFLKFILKNRPEERPTASRTKKHPFLKIDSNPFLKDLNACWCKNNSDVNPFRCAENPFDLKNRGDISKASSEDHINDFQNKVVHQPLVHHEVVRGEMDVTEPALCVAQIDCPTKKKSKSLRKTVKNWFTKQFNRIRKRK